MDFLGGPILYLIWSPRSEKILCQFFAKFSPAAPFYMVIFPKFSAAAGYNYFFTIFNIYKVRWRGLMLRKYDFRGLKGQFDVKKVNFRALIAKIGRNRPILTTRIDLKPIFMEYATGTLP